GEGLLDQHVPGDPRFGQGGQICGARQHGDPRGRWSLPGAGRALRGVRVGGHAAHRDHRVPERRAGRPHLREPGVPGGAAPARRRRRARHPHHRRRSRAL
ncbi:MAG: hypothetical protein AVDCRST_MAG50-2021, partial [uncultured Acidimicrobiales bacterium]